MSASDKVACSLDEPVELAAWNPAWQATAQSLIVELTSSLGSNAPIEHIGSTAVQGMPAKPIIDLMIGAENAAEQEAFARALAKIGWEDMGEAGVSERRHLRRRSSDHANLHIVLIRSHHWNNNLALRDYLRVHPEEQRAYAAMKRSLTSRGVNRLLAYSDQKASFIVSLLARATQWRTTINVVR